MMKKHHDKRFLVGLPAILAMALICCLSPALKGDGPKKSDGAIDFNRQILPILSENCFACHGPEAGKRKAKLRLDTKEGAFAELRSGRHAIVAGKLDESSLVDRITSDDSSSVMPPPSTSKQLTADQKDLLKKWID